MPMSWWKRFLQKMSSLTLSSVFCTWMCVYLSKFMCVTTLSMLACHGIAIGWSLLESHSLEMVSICVWGKSSWNLGACTHTQVVLMLFINETTVTQFTVCLYNYVHNRYAYPCSLIRSFMCWGLPLPPPPSSRWAGIGEREAGISSSAFGGHFHIKSIDGIALRMTRVSRWNIGMLYSVY